MRWMRWVVVLVVLVHTPLACTVWEAYRLAAALATPLDSSASSKQWPFEVACGKILDHAPVDLSHSKQRISKRGANFVLHPQGFGRSHPEGQAQPRAAAEDQQSTEEFQLSWLGGESLALAEAASIATLIQESSWRPLEELSGESPGKADQLAYVLVNPSRAWERASLWNRIEFFYLSWTYPGLRAFFLDLDLEARLSEWDEVQSNGRMRASAVAGCGSTFLEECLDFVSSCVQMTDYRVLSNRGTGAEQVAEGLKQGATYVVFPQLGDPTQFSFHAWSQGRSYRMGSRVPAGSELIFQAGQPVLFTLFSTGENYRQLQGTYFSLTADQPGIYRVVASRPDLPLDLAGQTWVVSSPIFVGP